MGKKLLDNRISKTVAPDALSKVRQAMQLLDEALGEEISITAEDYKALRKIADKLKRVTDDVYDIAKENTDFIEEPVTLAEIQKDKTFYEFCDDVFALLKAFILRLEKEQNVAGAEYYNALCIYEDDVSRKAAKGNAKAQNVKAQLDAVDRNQGGGSSKRGGDSDSKK
ncbi:MAG: hypothetical protein JNL70_15115 [Saprospiraceae bacterium]|nr:hypothetical protein [Saprospiraceae bacterium]